MASIPTEQPEPDFVLSRELRHALKPLASLKVTVTVFGLALFLVFVGSIAQAQKDVWQVVDEYFRTWIAVIEIRDLFPPAWCRWTLEYDWGEDPMRLYYPGGWLLGTVAAINLVAAHLVRFRVQAKDGRLAIGAAVLLGGIAVTWLVVAGGMNADGFQKQQNYKLIWNLFKGAAVVSCLGLAGRLTMREQRPPSSFIVAGGLLGVAAWVMTVPVLHDSSMRILWQLMKAQFASLILLGGCWLIFRKRCGIVLLHAGVGVLMVSEVQVAMTADETRLQIHEGDTTNYAFSIRERELVIVEYKRDKGHVVSVPVSRVASAAKEKLAENRVIQDERLPFDLEVVEFQQNSSVRKLRDSERSPATAGLGLQYIAVKEDPGTGMDSSPDLASAYIRVKHKESSKSRGTWLLSQHTNGLPESIVVDGRIFDVSMRFKRTYKPYAVTLIDARREDYLGTGKARDYSSYIRLQDPRHDVDRKVRVWMNNPLRYRGETFYQSGLEPDPNRGVEVTTLQVVTNRGWMLPYMACMIVATGLAVQFLLVFSQDRRRSNSGTAAWTLESSGWITAAAVFLIVGGYFVSKFVQRPPPDGAPNLLAFSQVPVAKGGRQQPIGSVAMNRMRVLTNGKSVFYRELRDAELIANWDQVLDDVVAAVPGVSKDDFESAPTGVGELIMAVAEITNSKEAAVRHALERTGALSRSKSAITRRTPALWWMLDVISARPEAPHHRVVRIDDPTLLEELRLKKREGQLYSLAEIEPGYKALGRHVDLAVKLNRENANRLSTYQRALLQLATDRSRIRQLGEVFSELEFDPDRAFESLGVVVRYKLGLDEMGNIGDSSLVLPIPRPTGRAGEATEVAPKEDYRELESVVEGHWESVALATIKQGLLEYCRKKKIRSVDALVEDLCSELPAQGPVLMLEGAIKNLQQEPRLKRPINELAKLAMQTLERDDVLLRFVLRCIADSEHQTPRAIYDDLDEAARRQLFGIYAGTLLQSNVDLVSKQMQSVIRDVSTGLEDALRQLARELADRVITDEELAAGPSEELVSFRNITKAWKAGDFSGFNEATAAHLKLMAETDLVKVETERVSFEAWFNAAAPSYYCVFMYLFAFVVSCIALLGWSNSLGRIAFSTALATFFVHSFALIARIYISGRPPVTNLYSSAVFIGWAAVAFGLVFEWVNRRGIGNLVGTVAGASTLVIAYFLGQEGDTFEVLVAVLDTQFWLATHVVTVTLGYATTFLAGLFGLLYIVRGVLTPTLQKDDRKALARMMYGSVCFAMLFSFIGTVLGGLWADDSWGRFWGWDPKENGALMIVIWNALILHAKWDGMIRERGLAVLAVCGNIVTSWSWFGVNELGAGLHNYGFTEGRLFWLTVFVLVNLIIVSLGTLPKSAWMSLKTEQREKNTG